MHNWLPRKGGKEERTGNMQHRPNFLPSSKGYQAQYERATSARNAWLLHGYINHLVIDVIQTSRYHAASDRSIPLQSCFRSTISLIQTVQKPLARA